MSLSKQLAKILGTPFEIGKQDIILPTLKGLSNAYNKSVFLSDRIEESWY